MTSAPLEQVVSADVGAIAEMNVRPGMQVAAGQPLFRVDSETAVRNVEQARQELETAQIAALGARQLVVDSPRGPQEIA